MLCYLFGAKQIKENRKQKGIAEENRKNKRGPTLPGRMPNSLLPRPKPTTPCRLPQPARWRAGREPATPTR